MPNLYGVKNTPLRFDFGIYEYNKLKCLIEVDGEYHFKPIRGKIAFMRQKSFDGKKDAYCLSHKIKLIRIPYWEINNLTFQKIFNTQNFVVTRKFHNQFLCPPN